MFRTIARRVSLLGVMIAMAVAGMAPAANAQLNGDDFDPGFIISDADFFAGSAMSSSQVQAFLNAKVPECASGYVCLKDYRQHTPNIPADNYCDGYSGRSNESAATIIARVGQSCGVSQKVLLVLMQKEMSLVTHTWPSSWRYDKATGFACPDTAPCDSTYGGFIYQLFYAARQYQLYAAFPDRYRHQAGTTENVYWHPNASCGTGKVYIVNQATAGLYNYTPYQPNAAALNNLYGTGNSCSSYGNRNFWRIYTEWFGDSQGGGHEDIALHWKANSWLGSPTSSITEYDYNGGGLVQGYANGAITWTSSSGAATLSGAIRTYYGSHSGVRGDFGWPADDPVTSSVSGGGTAQEFDNASIWESPAGVFHSEGSLRTAYKRYNSYKGGLGWPTSNAYTDSTTGFAAQNFQNGTMLTSGSKYGWTRTADIPALVSMGAFTGSLGWPAGDVNSTTASGGGTVQAFTGGAVTRAKNSSQMFLLTGDLRSAFGDEGGLGGELGWPTSNAYTETATGFAAQDFQGGTLLIDGSKSAIVDPADLPELVNLGAFTGSLGWPAGPVNTNTSSGGGTVQAFTGGAVTQANGSDSKYYITGTLRTAFGKTGGLAGELGWPTSNAYTETATGFAAQDFQGGTLTLTPEGAVMTPVAAAASRSASPDSDVSDQKASPSPSPSASSSASPSPSSALSPSPSASPSVSPKP
ncbi:LGFP repeat-containing protein [Demequina sediminicola]|uniref:LGFP repeat-containing protein n=1 Tax=Demequina sediminicola TaxID=1095026 RepID=UPI0007803367|nr:hypothetical protein [Demequina sediminicola]